MQHTSKERPVTWDDGASEFDLAGERIVSKYRAKFQELQAPPQISGYVIDRHLVVVEVHHG
jgi:hypothetical protein